MSLACSLPLTPLHLFKFERRVSASDLVAPCWCIVCWLGGSVPVTGAVTNKAKIQEEARFQILRSLSEDPKLSQRELSVRVGISLGAVNYCLNALIDRGLVKAQNFKRSPKKIGYAYFLTPSGIAEKTRLTGSFLRRKLLEYDALNKEIEVLKTELGSGRILPDNISDVAN